MRQAQRNLVLLAGLTAASLGIGLFAWYGVKAPDEQKAERKAVEERLFSAHVPGEKGPDGGTPAPARLTRLTVQAKGDTTVLERTDSGWRVVSPVQARADGMAADALASRVETGKLDEVVEESPTDADLERYGLKAPRFTITASAQLPGGGEKTVALYGGIENPFNGAVYMRREGDPRVYMAQGGIRYALEKSLFELRDKEVLGFTEAKLQAVEVKGKAHHYRLERGQDEAWHVVQPRAFDADAAALSSLLSGLRVARAEAFLTDSPEERKRLGLDKPLVEAVFTPESGSPVRVRLVQPTQDGVAHTYALREEGEQTVLAQVGDSAVTALDASPEGLRDKSALRFEREDVAQLVISPGSGKEAIALERVQGTDAGTSEDWQVVRPRTGPARRYKVSSLLWSLSALKASAVGEEAPKAWAKYGLTDSARSVALLDKGGKELARLWLGKEVPGKSGTVYARGSRDAVLELEASRLDELPTTVEDVLETPAADGGSAAAAAP